MKNKSIWIITILFSLMLVGVIIVQIWWINRVMVLNQKSFDDAVYKSLNAVVKQVGEKENFVFIKRQVETDEQLKKTKKFLKEQAAMANRHRTKISTAPQNISINVSSENGKETKTVVRIEKDGKGHKYVYNSVYVGAAAVDSIPSSGGITITPPIPPVAPTLETITGIDAKKESVEIILEKMLNIENVDSVSITPKEIEKMITHSIFQAQEKERRLISRELHDGIGQSLFGMF